VVVVVVMVVVVMVVVVVVVVVAAVAVVVVMAAVVVVVVVAVGLNSAFCIVICLRLKGSELKPGWRQEIFFSPHRSRLALDAPYLLCNGHRDSVPGVEAGAVP
jgi:hypothetical protein